MAPENETKPNLAKYYAVTANIENSDLPEITLKNISKVLFLLGLIALMVYVLMVYLFVRQEWVIIGPRTSFAVMGVFLMGLGFVLYLINWYFGEKSS